MIIDRNWSFKTYECKDLASELSQINFLEIDVLS